MGKVVEKKKKKKGRPSLLDLQKRTIREQQEQQLQLLLQQEKNQKRLNNSAPHSNPNDRTDTPVRRSTRRNPNPDSLSSEKGLDDLEEEGDDDESSGKRREKKLNLVVKLRNQKSSLNSSSLNSYDSDSNAHDDDVVSNNKKRKVDSIANGSEKGEKSISGTNAVQDGSAQLDLGPSTPLPDKKLLLFILDRLQKKDTYGVFSDPVDPQELPDYFEIIEHPMDFGTVKKKLSGGAYVNLEQFEKDVFLICSNAMQYNSPDTIYFRQARSIQELAKKNFENLRQDSDDNETEPKVVRRGRPPTKNLKKPLGRPPLEHNVPELSSSATLATTGPEKTNCSGYELRRAQNSEKSGLHDSSGKLSSTCNNDVYMTWLGENKFDRGEEHTGSGCKGNLMKLGKKQIVLDEKRRDTYKQFHSSVGGREPSVLNTFDGERKLLMPVGLHSEHGYARSVARFAANLGPVAWKIASKKIERSLPSGLIFGPGWIGENDMTPQRPLLHISSKPSQVSPLHPFLTPQNTSTATSTAPELKKADDKLSENAKENFSSKRHMDGHVSKNIPPESATSSSSSPFISCPEKAEAMDTPSGFSILESSNAIRPKPSLQINQSPVIHPGMNGFSLPTHMGKLVRLSRPVGLDFSAHQMQIPDPLSRADTSLHSEDTTEKLNTINVENSLPSVGDNEALVGPTNSWPSRRGLPAQQKADGAVIIPLQQPESVPPDLNVRFQSSGSPGSSNRVDSGQPDLALQL